LAIAPGVVKSNRGDGTTVFRHMIAIPKTQESACCSALQGHSSQALSIASGIVKSDGPRVRTFIARSVSLIGFE